MNNIINSILNWMKSHPLITVIGASLLLVVLVLSLTYYGATLKNRVSSWWYSRGTEQAHEDIDKVKGEASAAKAIAEQALKELAAEKALTAKLTIEREERERILADKTLTANEKLKLYEAAMEKPVSVTPVTNDLDALCARAAALGISCE